MVAVRTVAKDKRLPHQIVLMVTSSGSGSRADGVYISCNCRIRRRRPPFGQVDEDGELWAIYQAGQHDLRDGPLDRLVTGLRQDFALT